MGVMTETQEIDQLRAENERLYSHHSECKMELGQLVQLANKWKERALKSEAQTQLHFKLEEDGSLSIVAYKRTGQGIEIKEYIGRPAQFEWVEFKGALDSEKPMFKLSPLNVYALKKVLLEEVDAGGTPHE